ncbi:DNA polymerase III epsilon subunit [Babesia ovata]|uniref:DNA polymerase III epsilon subunit n=1 Tax=Babesia ovata TaxID=189622 RepID=A0A2H6KE12_9APIC|nr:DNA polymerase III epsilon subunit [Babesia ovata]GBE61233.1 DNA polymerase III epsilon subunit [Babesia ovata]
MEAVGADSSSPREESRRVWPCSCSFLDGLCRRYGINGRKLKSYSLFSLLLKSETLYLLYTCYVGLLAASHPDADPSHPVLCGTWLPLLWLLKPLIAAIADSVDRIMQYTSGIYGWVLSCGDSSATRGVRKRGFMDALVEFHRRCNLVLVLSQLGVVILMPTIMVYAYLHPLGDGCGPSLVAVLSLCQIATAAVSEGAFCRYAQCNTEMNEVQFASLRLLFMTGYGVWNMLGIVMPYPRTSDFWASFLALVNVLPCFLVGNGLCILWVLLCDPGGYEEAVDMSRRAETKWSPKVTVAFFTMMIMALSVRYPYDCLILRPTEYPSLTLLTLLVLSVVVKVLVSCLLWRFVTLDRMITIAKFAFLSSMVLMCGGHRIMPIPTGQSSPWYSSLVATFVTALQQVLFTFGLVLSIRTAPRGMEATIMSITDLCVDIVAFMFKSRLSLRPLALKVLQHETAVDVAVVFFCLYNFFVLFGKPQVASLMRRYNFEGLESARDELPLPLPVTGFPGANEALTSQSHIDIESSIVAAHEALKGADVDKSPWADESELSDV